MKTPLPSRLSQGIYWNCGKSAFLPDDFNSSLHGEGWGREFASLKAVGLDTIILFNADLLTQIPMLEEIFENAEKLGMKIILECGNRKAGKNIPLGQGPFEQTVKTLWNNFGKSPAFSGWYLFAEFNLDPTPEKYNDYFRGWSEYCKSYKADLPVMISPFYAPALHPPIMDYGDNGPEIYERYWDTLLQGTHIDILSLQDNGGQHFSFFTDTVNEPYIATFAKVCRNHGVRFFGNVEMGEMHISGIQEFMDRFTLEHGVNDAICRPCWRGVPPERIKQKFALMNKYSEANFSWGFREFYRESLNPTLYNAYRQLFQQITEP